MSDISYPVYPIFTFLGFVLVLIPLPWHLQAWNGATCLYMIWTSIACLNAFVNSVVWHNTAENLAPVWCDISTRIIVGFAVALPAASLSINRRLYKIATITVASISPAEKRRSLIIDLFIGLGVPIIQMALQYVVSGHRFDIYEDIGCYPFTYNTSLTFPLVSTWPIVLGFVSAVYCILTLRVWVRRRAELTSLLSSGGSITVNRYLRLMALAVVELVLAVSLSVYGLYLDISAGVSPWNGLADVHHHYSKVDQIPAVLWRSTTVSQVTFELNRWLVPFTAFVFFALFGFADETKRNYRNLFEVLKKRLAVASGRVSNGFRLFSKFSTGLSFKDKSLPVVSSPSAGTLPFYIPRISSATTFFDTDAMCPSTTIFDDKSPKSKLHLDLRFHSPISSNTEHQTFSPQNSHHPHLCTIHLLQAQRDPTC